MAIPFPRVVGAAEPLVADRGHEVLQVPPRELRGTHVHRPAIPVHGVLLRLWHAIDAVIKAILSATEVPLPAKDLHASVEDPKSRRTRIEQPWPVVAGPPEGVRVHPDFRTVGDACRLLWHLGPPQSEDQCVGCHALLKHRVSAAADVVDLDDHIPDPHVRACARSVPVLYQAWLQLLHDNGDPIAVVDVHPQPLFVTRPLYVDDALLHRLSIGT
mmetsp:Transcript_73947/g.165522  ORF Transcript_73947/g.165522 Transcript_73947/m.165522 type:complete len:215 (+) Transcript_73947:338-982(+)